ncbi:MAG TPA: C-type lectin domain-containing protein [Candidatus Limnocylindria bacterium]|nr:C-type lectin domain-containing protein [Candidatus Limnocylindria bacterium]
MGWSKGAGLSRLAYVAVVSLLVFSLAQAVIRPLVVYAAGETIQVGAPVSGVYGTPVAISSVQIVGSGGSVVPVQLQVQDGDLSFGSTTGLTFESDTTGPHLGFSGTVDDINAALLTLQYERTDGIGTDTLEVSLSEYGEVFFPDNGHVYEFVDPGAGINWVDSETAAEGLTKYGKTGHLVTITSQAENDYVAERLLGDGWMGATDQAVEGDWRWVSGPENGTLFWQGLGGEGGAAVGGNYSNWASGEPNDSSDEDCAQFYVDDATWNDLHCVNSELNGYVVEYGDETPIEIATATLSITTVGETIEVASCEELQTVDDDPDASLATIQLTNDIDCEGIEVESLFGDDGFSGTFDGQNHTISNMTIDQAGNAVGLIAFTRDSAVLKNLKLSGGSVSGNSFVGALVGEATDTSIENVTSSVDVSGSWAVGGLVGSYESSGNNYIRDSSSSGAVVGQELVGGLIGKLDSYGSITVERVFATGNVTTTTWSEAGGLIGRAGAYSEEANETIALIIQDVYAQGNVSAGQYTVGGLIGALKIESDGVGYEVELTLQRAYASGNVSGQGDVGGLIGNFDAPDADQSATFVDTFAAGAVSVTEEEAARGGVIGYLSELDEGIFTSEDHFYDQERTGQSDCSQGDAALENCTAVNTDGSQDDYFINNSTSPPLDDWNFSSVWEAQCDDYPVLQWQNLTNDECGSGSNSDGDGISDAVEDAAPNGGDANDDGTADSEQVNVSSFVSQVSSEYVSLEVDPACTISAVSMGAEPTTKDAGFDYPVGLMNFTVDCGTPGYTTTVTQYYHGVADDTFVLRKYKPSTNAYFNVSDASLEQVTIAGRNVLKAAYEITDGGVLDDDGTANGSIVDPVGLAESVVGAPNTGLGGRAQN